MQSNCRSCGHILTKTFCDLGHSPPSNSYLKTKEDAEKTYPLKALVCDLCFLVQLEQFQTPDELFSQYAYFSSFSDSWVNHAKRYVDSITEKLHLSAQHLVIEIASNDGYLLQHVQKKGIKILGIEPAQNIGEIAIAKGIPTIKEFFDSKLAKKLSLDAKADLLIANNVLAHVPDLSDFVQGIHILLKEDGVATLEFPHLLQLIKQNQFDTIYHEHFSYFSLLSAKMIFEKHHLDLFAVEELPTHGGSLRVYLQQQGGKRLTEPSVDLLLSKEKRFGLHLLNTYSEFSKKTLLLKEKILHFFHHTQKTQKKIAGYGAPAKGNTLLNYCHLNETHLPFTVDLNPYKQNLFLPGSRIPIFPPSKIREYQPDYLLILPWNLKEEIKSQMAFIRDWGGKFVTAIPDIVVE